MIFKLFGIKIRISFLFIALISTFVLIESSKMMVYGLSAALIHELGHILVMIFVGSKPSEIAFGVFDVNIKDYDRNKRNYVQDIFILIGGPLANLFGVGILYLLHYVIGNQNTVLSISENLFLCVFNLLPIESLDGGQILYIFLSSKFDEHKSVVILKFVSFVILFPLAIIGFYILLKSKNNFSLLLISCYLIAVVLIKKGHCYNI